MRNLLRILVGVIIFSNMVSGAIAEPKGGIPESLVEELVQSPLNGNDKTMADIIANRDINDIALNRVAGKSRCSRVEDGWYLDSRTAPTGIIACPQTCEMLEAMNGEEVSLLVGCETVMAEDDAGSG